MCQAHSIRMVRPRSYVMSFRPFTYPFLHCLSASSSRDLFFSFFFSAFSDRYISDRRHQWPRKISVAEWTKCVRYRSAMRSNLLLRAAIALIDLLMSRRVCKYRTELAADVFGIVLTISTDCLRVYVLIVTNVHYNCL